MENITAQRIKEERESRGWTQEYLAELLGLRDSSYISKIEKGKRNVTPDEVVALADIYNCSVHYLLGTTSVKNVIQINNPEKLETAPTDSLTIKVSHLPILGTIRAGLPILADENIEGYLDVPESMRADYVLRVVGDSMIGAGILDGDYAVCRESQEANSGQIVVAIKDIDTGYSEATLKYYYNNGNGYGPLLRPANPNYSELSMSDGYRIAGVMVALVRQDAPGYQVYKDYLAVNDSEEWTEVIELATEAGLKVNQVKEILSGQIEIAKKLRG